MNALAKKKSPGPDNIPIELLKYGGEGTTKAIPQLCQEMWKMEAKKPGISLNIKKTKIMSSIELRNVVLDEQVEVVDQFKILGSMINQGNSCSQYIRRKLALGHTATGKLTLVWREKNVSIQNEVRLVSTLVFSVALYGSGT